MGRPRKKPLQAEQLNACVIHRSRQEILRNPPEEVFRVLTGSDPGVISSGVLPDFPYSETYSPAGNVIEATVFAPDSWYLKGHWSDACKCIEVVVENNRIYVFAQVYANDRTDGSEIFAFLTDQGFIPVDVSAPYIIGTYEMLNNLIGKTLESDRCAVVLTSADGIDFGVDYQALARKMSGIGIVCLVPDIELVRQLAPTEEAREQMVPGAAAALTNMYPGKELVAVNCFCIQRGDFDNDPAGFEKAIIKHFGTDGRSPAVRDSVLAGLFTKAATGFARKYSDEMLCAFTAKTVKPIIKKFSKEVSDAKALNDSLSAENATLKASLKDPAPAQNGTKTDPEYEEYIAGLESRINELTDNLSREKAKSESLSENLKNTKVSGYRLGFNPVKDTEFYNGELHDLFITLAKEKIAACPDNIKAAKRSIDLLRAFVDANGYSKNREEFVSSLSRAIDTASLDPIKNKGILTRAGFEFETGPHCRLTYNGDPRYIFTVSSSPSDVRTGQNLRTELFGRLLG